MSAAAVRASLGLVALAAALSLALVAQDARRWPAALLAGDVRFAAAPFGAQTWQPPDRVPLAPARRLLGVDDDVAFRRALKLYRATKPDNPSAFTMTVNQRASLLLDANRALRVVARDDGVPARRSVALNLLALLSFQDPTPDQSGFARSGRLFAAAVRADPANEQAKRNLELYLRLAPRRQSPSGGGGQRRRKFGQTGAGLQPAGSGY